MPENTSMSGSAFASRIRASATPKKTAKTMSASISPVSASTAAARGFLGMRDSNASTQLWAC